MPVIAKRTDPEPEMWLVLVLLRLSGRRVNLRTETASHAITGQMQLWQRDAVSAAPNFRQCEHSYIHTLLRST